MGWSFWFDRNETDNERGGFGWCSYLKGEEEYGSISGMEVSRSEHIHFGGTTARHVCQGPED